MRGRLIVACAVLGLILLGGCAEDPADKNTSDRPATVQPTAPPVEDSPAGDEGGEQMEAKTFIFNTMQGARGELTVGAELSDLAAEIEKERAAADGKPLTYVTIDVDNRDGTESATVGRLVLIDADGKQYESVYWPDVIGEWQEGTPAETYNRLSKLMMRVSPGLHVGARDKAVMAFDGDLPETFVTGAIYLYGTIGEPTYLAPVE